MTNQYAYISDFTFEFYKSHLPEFELFFNPISKCICYGRVNSNLWFDKLKPAKVDSDERYATIDGKKYALIWDETRTEIVS